jgi:hypothetical protein
MRVARPRFIPLPSSLRVSGRINKENIRANARGIRKGLAKYSPQITRKKRNRICIVRDRDRLCIPVSLKRALR